MKRSCSNATTPQPMAARASRRIPLLSIRQRLPTPRRARVSNCARSCSTSRDRITPADRPGLLAPPARPDDRIREAIQGLQTTLGCFRLRDERFGRLLPAQPARRATKAAVCARNDVLSDNLALSWRDWCPSFVRTLTL